MLIKECPRSEPIPAKMPARRRASAALNGFKWTLTLILVAGAAVILSQGHLRWNLGRFVYRLGDFQWLWPVMPREIMGLLAGAGLVVFYRRALRRPHRRAGAHAAAPVREWGAMALFGLGLGGVAAAVLMQGKNWPVLYWPLPLVPLGLGGFLAWLLFQPAGRRLRIDRLGAALAGRRGPGRMTRVGLGLLAAALGAAVALVSWRIIHEGFPIIIDSHSQIAQARLMYGGHWRLEISQALRDVITFPYGVHTAPTYSQYPPGYILPLLAMLALHLPYQLVDVAAAAGLAVLTALLAARAARQATGARSGVPAATVAVLLLAGSPLVGVLSGILMNHGWTALLLTGAAAAFITAGFRVLEAPGRRVFGLAILGGLALGGATMTRPVTGLAQGLVWGVAGLMLAARCRTQGRPALRAWGRLAAGAILGGALPMAFFLYYNSQTTGHPLVMGYQISNPMLHKIGLNPAWGFTLKIALQRLMNNIIALNFQLFGWTCFSWLAIALWWLSTRLRPLERLLLALILVQTAFYTLYQYHDLLIGPRFLYETLPYGCVLGGVGMMRVFRRGPRRAVFLWIVILLLAGGGFCRSVSFWSDKLSALRGRQERLSEFVRQLPPIKVPTVIVIDEVKAEYVGLYFPSLPGEAPLWFITSDKVEQAMGRPELAHARWLMIQPH